MKGYKTRKDYKRLKELLDKEYKVVFFQKNNPLPSLAGKDDEYYWFWECGLATITNDYDYLLLCKRNDIEFIEPEEE